MRIAIGVQHRPRSKLGKHRRDRGPPENHRCVDPVFRSARFETQLVRLNAVRHQNTMTARKVIANKVAKNGMPLAISPRSARVGILPLLSLIEATCSV
jgi:hypothetical protein